jgi:hypothetical protein
MPWSVPTSTLCLVEQLAKFCFCNPDRLRASWVRPGDTRFDLAIVAAIIAAQGILRLSEDHTQCWGPDSTSTVVRTCS